MSKSKKRLSLFGAIIILGVISLFLLSGNTLLSPASAIIGCTQKPEFFGAILSQSDSQYNNCAVDSISKINAEKFNKDEISIRNGIIKCMNNKGIDPVINGVKTGKQLQVLMDCNKLVMKGVGIKGNLENGKIAKTGTSPFKDNCPKIGDKIVFIGDEHSVACDPIECNAEKGYAKLTCQESNSRQPIEDAGWKYDMEIDGNGIIHVPRTTMDNKQASSWMKIID